MTSNTPPSSRTALRTLLIVVGIVLAVVIYAYGWNSTEISLDEVQDPKRTSSVQRALQELLSPNIFDRDVKREVLDVPFQIGCQEGTTVEQPAHGDSDPYVVFDPPCADPDDVIHVEGFNFPPDAIAGLRLVRENGQNLPFKLANVTADATTVSDESTFDVDSSGYFNVDVKVPRGRGLSGQTHTIEIPTISPTGWPRLSDTTNEVIDKMIETIFLALMATTLAVPISVALSFLSARNLMKQVHLPLGSVLVGFVLMPVGGLLGYWLVGPIGRLGLDLGLDLWPGLLAILVAIALFLGGPRLNRSVVAWIAALGGTALLASVGAKPSFSQLLSLRGAARNLAGGIQRVRKLSLNLLLLVMIIFIIGTLAGIGIWIGDKLDSGITKYLGQFFGTLGKLGDLTLRWVAAIGGAALLASVGATVSAGVLRDIHPPASSVLGGLLGLFSGVILFALTAYIGTQAVLLGLLTPIVAAALGGQVLWQLWRSVFGAKAKRDETNTDQAIHSTLVIVGAVAAFLLTAYVLDLPRAIVDERAPSVLPWDLGLFSVRVYVAKAAIIGGVLGGLAGMLSGTSLSFPLGMAVYNTSRTILNALRSIEPLIMGIVFVIWVGVGPFAGVLALTLHSIASLGKLYSEQVESIESGPIEAIQATGATRLQTIIYGVVPQIVPPYIAFTMYRWDINVRMSTIIGFVGGGGIGFLLQQQINLLQYKQAGVAVLAIAIVVSILDYASAAIRERIV